MAWQYVPLQITAGVDVEKTPLLAATNWVQSSAIRFRDGLPEKIGGWSALNSEALVGICTGMHSWADLSSNIYIACGTDQRLELFSGGTLIDITPLRSTDDVTPQFSTATSSNVVNVKDTGNGALATDWVNMPIPVSVGGIILQGEYQIQTIVDSDNYTILSASPATANVTDGGAVPAFTTVMSSADVTVTLDNHGLVAGNAFAVQIQVMVGGLTIDPDTYTVTAITDADNFVIQPGGSAFSAATVSENSGNVSLEYLVHTGPQSAYFSGSSGAYGAGIYGAGIYGGSSGPTAMVPLRQWFPDNFGQDLVCNYTGSPIFVWTPPIGADNRALAINTTNYPDAADPPLEVNFSFVADQQQMIIAGGCNDPNTDTFDPNLLRWCDEGDFTDWSATSLNQAGSYRIPTGSYLVGGMAAPNFVVIWTNIDMYLMNYLGGTGLAAAVWGFSKVSGATGLLSARSCAVYQNLVFFAASNGIFVFNGNVITLIPCPVWDKFWKNLDRDQVDKVNMQVNSYFQELSLSFPSASGNGTVDSRITYNMRENSWTYDDAPTLTARTAWIDQNEYGSPAGTDLNGYIQQQDTEGVYDADGMALPASVRTGWFAVQEGSLVAMMERIEADLYVTGGNGTIYLTVYAQDYATGPVRTYGPYPWIVGQGPPYSIVRARGRFISVEISSTGTGIWWRVGNIRYRAQQAGGRP